MEQKLKVETTSKIRKICQSLDSEDSIKDHRSSDKEKQSKTSDKFDILVKKYMNEMKVTRD